MTCPWRCAMLSILTLASSMLLAAAADMEEGHPRDGHARAAASRMAREAITRYGWSLVACWRRESPRPLRPVCMSLATLQRMYAGRQRVIFDVVAEKLDALAARTGRTYVNPEELLRAALPTATPM